jgi:hypothetical protein
MCAFMGVQLSMHIFLWVMQGSYVFSGKEEDVDLLLLKAESFVVFGARPVVLLLDGGRR